MARHRAPVRLRYGRIAAAAAALTITCIALLGSFGVLGDGSAQADLPGQGRPAARGATVPEAPASSPTARKREKSAESPESLGALSQGTTSAESRELPEDSGEGRRAVFSQSQQHVWMVNRRGAVVRDYPVSGSVLDNLDPGTYEVYSRSRHAVGIDDSGTMGYFVRFTKGPSGAAIGFHDIPVKDGEPLQKASALGTPQSHGCIRQQRRDARAMWRFAPLGTTVVVTA